MSPRAARAPGQPGARNNRLAEALGEKQKLGGTELLPNGSGGGQPGWAAVENAPNLASPEPLAGEPWPTAPEASLAFREAAQQPSD